MTPYHEALLAMFVHFRREAKRGNPIQQFWAEYYWRKANCLLIAEGLTPTWSRKEQKWILTITKMA